MKAYFHTFGCRVNQYETQQLRERLDAEPAESFEDADLCVVNTCTVTATADRDALRLVRKIARRNPAARLVVTGCLATRDPKAILKEAPAALVIGNKDKDSIPALLGCSAAPMGVTGLSSRSRAFVKIQDGCNMACRFCVIPAIRPELSSKPFAELKREIAGLIARGIPEVVLCGVRLGRYLSTENGKRIDFVSALERLLALPGNFRVRLSSLEITDVGDRLIAVMAESNGKLCPSIHSPLQSGSTAVLKKMGRWYSAEFYARRIAALKERVPHVGLFADVMTGFPGETEDEHQESVAFIEKTGFSGLHVFRYSKRPGTPAARAPEQVSEGGILRRAQELRALDEKLRAAFAARAAGLERTVVPELSGLEALTEDFLTVRLPKALPPGLHRARVEGRLLDGVPTALVY